MIYYAVSILVGILLLFLYYTRLDKIEQKYGIEFLRKENSQFLRFIDVWKSRKAAGHPGLKKSIMLVTLVRVVAILTIFGPFIIHITKD